MTTTSNSELFKRYIKDGADVYAAFQNANAVRHFLFELFTLEGPTLAFPGSYCVAKFNGVTYKTAPCEEASNNNNNNGKQPRPPPRPSPSSSSSSFSSKSVSWRKSFYFFNNSTSGGRSSPIVKLNFYRPQAHLAASAGELVGSTYFSSELLTKGALSGGVRWLDIKKGGVQLGRCLISWTHVIASGKPQESALGDPKKKDRAYKDKKADLDFLESFVELQKVDAGDMKNTSAAKKKKVKKQIKSPENSMIRVFTCLKSDVGRDLFHQAVRPLNPPQKLNKEGFYTLGDIFNYALNQALKARDFTTCKTLFDLSTMFFMSDPVTNANRFLYAQIREHDAFLSAAFWEMTFLDLFMASRSEVQQQQRERKMAGAGGGAGAGGAATGPGAPGAGAVSVDSRLAVEVLCQLSAHQRSANMAAGAIYLFVQRMCGTYKISSESEPYKLLQSFLDEQCRLLDGTDAFVRAGEVKHSAVAGDTAGFQRSQQSQLRADSQFKTRGYWTEFMKGGKLHWHNSLTNETLTRAPPGWNNTGLLGDIQRLRKGRGPGKAGTSPVGGGARKRNGGPSGILRPPTVPAGGGANSSQASGGTGSHTGGDGGAKSPGPRPGRMMAMDSKQVAQGGSGPAGSGGGGIATESKPTLFPGEYLLDSVSGVSNLSMRTADFDGSLFVSNFRVIFKTVGPVTLAPRAMVWFQAPVACCDRVKVRALEKDCVQLKILLRDLRVMYFRVTGPRTSTLKKLNDLKDLIMKQALFGAPRNSFAFKFKDMVSQDNDGWRIFDMRKELARQGVDAQPMDEKKGSGAIPGKWVLVDNRNFEFSPTYPSWICVPHGTARADLDRVAKFRSKARIPALVYHAHNGACMLRSSQPMVGVNFYHRCKQDEDLLKSAGVTVVIDARPKANAVANMAKGGGYEKVENYGCAIEFCDIQNIHSMRDSLNKLWETCLKSAKTDTCLTADDWHKEIVSSSWLKHVRAVLLAASNTATLIAKGTSVLVHCSDGWDRTAQLTALAQLMLDPYFRTTRGFACLVEKEWLGFGHKMRQRLGHGTAPDSERSPILLQFLDCVFQLQSQFPSAFEFNHTFISVLASSLYSCKFGTFLHNNERERAEDQVRSSTMSVWSYLMIDLCKNVLYTPQKKVLLPVCDARLFHVWPYFYRSDRRFYNSHLFDPTHQSAFRRNYLAMSRQLQIMREREREYRRRLGMDGAGGSSSGGGSSDSSSASAAAENPDAARSFASSGQKAMPTTAAATAPQSTATKRWPPVGGVGGGSKPDSREKEAEKKSHRRGVGSSMWGSGPPPIPKTNGGRAVPPPLPHTTTPTTATAPAVSLPQLPEDAVDSPLQLAAPPSSYPRRPPNASPVGVPIPGKLRQLNSKSKFQTMPGPRSRLDSSTPQTRVGVGSLAIAVRDRKGFDTMVQLGSHVPSSVRDLPRGRRARPGFGSRQFHQPLSARSQPASASPPAVGAHFADDEMSALAGESAESTERSESDITASLPPLPPLPF